MDDKTAELREIFIDVSDRDTVTESQEESPGSLADDTDRRERVADLIAEMQDTYEFESSFDVEALVRIADGYFEDESDAELAATFDTTADAIREARLDLHLIRDDDRSEIPEIDRVQEALDAGRGPAELATDFDLEPDAAELAARLVRTEQEMMRSNYRFRDEFRSLLGDEDLSDQLTEAAKQDGLEDATEGIETTTAF